MHRRPLLSALPAAAFAAGLNPALAAVGQPVTIGIMGGEIDGTFMRVATDLSSVLNSNDMRIVPIVGKGSLQNIGDLLHLPGVDLALVAADALTYAQTAHLYPGELEKIQYICKLFRMTCTSALARNTEFVGSARKACQYRRGWRRHQPDCTGGLEDVGIAPDLRTDEPGIGQEKLNRGEIAANIYAAGKPVRLFATAPAGTGLHFIPIPSNQEIEKVYVPGGLLTHAEYPTLVPEDAPVETVGVGVTLAVFGWQPGTDGTGTGQFRRCVFHEVSGIAEAATPSGVAQCQPRCRPARVDPVSGGRGVACTASSCFADACRCESAGAVRGLSYAARRSATDSGAERGHIAILPAATGTGALRHPGLQDVSRQRNWRGTGRGGRPGVRGRYMRDDPTPCLDRRRGDASEHVHPGRKIRR